MIQPHETHPILRVRDLSKSYKMGQVDVHALKGVSLDIFPGQMTAIVGRSGS